MSALFGLRGEAPTDLDRFMHDVWRAKAEGDMGALSGLLSKPWGGAKSGLHALRDGLTALAKLARDEHAAERREAGWLPWNDLLAHLVEEQGPPEQRLRHPSHEHLRRLLWAGKGDDGAQLSAVVEVDGEWSKVASRNWRTLAERDPEELGSNSEVPSG